MIYPTRAKLTAATPASTAIVAKTSPYLPVTATSTEEPRTLPATTYQTASEDPSGCRKELDFARIAAVGWTVSDNVQV